MEGDAGATANKDAEEIAMHNKITSQRGMSLVEATIILMVLAILTSVLGDTCKIGVGALTVSVAVRVVLPPPLVVLVNAMLAL